MTDSKQIENITDLTTDPHNLNVGTERGLYVLDDSLSEVGAGRSIVADRGGVVLAGNKTLQVAADKGFPVRVVQTDGSELVVVQRTDLDLSGEGEERKRAQRLAVYDNRSSEIGLGWSAGEMARLLEEDGDIFEGLFQDWELAELGVEGFIDGDFLGVAKDAQPNPRQLPIDVIFTLDNYRSQWTPMAYYSGWKWGLQSNSKVLSDNYNPHYVVTFVDNVYTDYIHDDHVAAVKRFKPKYATVRDIMDKAQCDKAGIEYHSFEQIMDWAQELEQYAASVIVIPKYDCLDKIPERFILGYSVPTSHGGTPLPVEMFRGRRVHLLGGSWKAQLAHMAQLGDDVVALDNNHCLRIAAWGQFYFKDGETGVIRDLMGYEYPNVATIALAISLGSVCAKINELYAGNCMVEEPSND